MNPTSAQAFRASLTPQVMRTFQVVHAAIAAGILTFSAVVVIVYLQSAAVFPAESDIFLLTVLTAVHAFMATGLVFAGRAIAEVLCARQGPSADAAECVALIRKAAIIRLATMEGGAFFGLVVLIVGSTNGVVHAFPAFLLNGLTAFNAIAYIVLTFPTADRLEQVFRTKILKLG